MAAEVYKVTGDVTLHIPEVCVNKTKMLPTGTDVIVDLSEVGEIDSTCVAMMITMRRHVQVNGNAITFTNLPETLMRLTNLYDLTDVLDIDDAKQAGGVANAPAG